ncbi:MAG: hypothetical protein ACLPND_24165, partial [Candidatus Korobacteraceae bacterium]
MMVIVEVPAPGAGMGLGLKLAVAPDGSPEADKLIGLSKAPLMLVVIVDVTLLPWATLTEVGEADIRKSGANVTSVTPRKAIG